jgi:DNA-binding MarR family transcriptional regulator
MLDRHLHFGRRLRRTSRSIDRALGTRFAEIGITLSQYHLLRELDPKAGLTLRELSARVDVADPSTLLTLDLLESRGLVRRTRSTNDRRKVHVFLTAAGQRMLTEAQSMNEAANEVALRGVLRRDLAAALELFEHILDNLDAAANGEDQRASKR